MVKNVNYICDMCVISLIFQVQLELKIYNDWCNTTKQEAMKDIFFYLYGSNKLINETYQCTRFDFLILK